MPKKFSPVNASHLANLNYSVTGENAALVHSVIRDSVRTYGEVDVKDVLPNPFQPRKNYNQERLQGLATSIAENGLIEPIVVRRSPTQEGKLEIICGERRVRATRDILRWQHIAAEILDQCTDEQAHRIAVLENVQRDDLNPLEIGMAYRSLLDEKDETGRSVYTIRSLSEQLGKNKDTIQEYVSLLGLPQEIQSLLEQENPIPRRVALELASLDTTEDRPFLIEQYQTGELKPSQLLKIIREYKHQQNSPAPSELFLKKQGASFPDEHDEREGQVPIDQGKDLLHREAHLSSKRQDQTDQAAPVTKASPNPGLALISLRSKLEEQDKLLQKFASKYRKEFPDMSPEERKLLIEFVRQWQQQFEIFSSLQ